jgi:hypothetical protein
LVALHLSSAKQQRQSAAHRRRHLRPHSHHGRGSEQSAQPRRSHQPRPSHFSARSHTRANAADPKILRALPPVSSDLLELIELVDVGAGRHHIQSEFRGKSHQNQVPGQEPGECGEHTVHQHHLITRSSLRAHSGYCPRTVHIRSSHLFAWRVSVGKSLIMHHSRSFWRPRRSTSPTPCWVVCPCAAESR